MEAAAAGPGPPPGRRGKIGPTPLRSLGMSEAPPTADRRRRQYTYLASAGAVTIPGAVISRAHTDLPDPVLALIFGLAIVGAAFLLSWAAEVAQLDISAGLAIAVLAFIAVLPEYAVDLVFALNGGEAYKEFGVACQSAAQAAAQRESDCALALANMTGANRLLIGLGWTMVVFIAWRRLKARGQRMDGIQLERTHAVELSFLSVATIYSLTLPLKDSITLIDSAVLVSIFVLYMIRISKAPAEEPHLVGPAEAMGQLPTKQRRMAVVGLFLFAALIILLCAEEFAHALVESGHSVGISEFFLVQWLAPLASEAPELLVAGLYAYRLNTNAALGTLVSSKVNQWTLLVGTLPIAFAIASSSTDGLPDHRPAAGGGLPHRRPVVLRRRHPHQPVDVAAGGGSPLHPLLGPVLRRGGGARGLARAGAGAVRPRLSGARPVGSRPGAPRRSRASSTTGSGPNTASWRPPIHPNSLIDGRRGLSR